MPVSLTVTDLDSERKEENKLVNVANLKHHPTLNIRLS